MAISQQLQERIEALAAELRYEVHGPRGCPPWGTKFVDMEQETTEIGDARVTTMAIAARTAAGRAGHPRDRSPQDRSCHHPIPDEQPRSNGLPWPWRRKMFSGAGRNGFGQAMWTE